MSRPTKPKHLRDRGGGSGNESRDGDFVGKEHPTYFKFKGKKPEVELIRNCEKGRRCRIDFETDVNNGYFGRDTNPGQMDVKVLQGILPEAKLDHSVSLWNGYAHVTLTFPEESIIGDEITLNFIVNDDIIQEPFVNTARLHIIMKRPHQGGRGKRGQKGGKGNNKLGPAGIALPKIQKIREEQWPEYNFDKFSSCRVIKDEDAEGQPTYEFYVNADNLYLQNEKVKGNDAPELVETKFVFATVLFGLGLIKSFNDEKQNPVENSSEKPDGDTVEDYVDRTTKALAPFILPIISYFGELSDQELVAATEGGLEE